MPPSELNIARGIQEKKNELSTPPGYGARAKINNGLAKKFIPFGARDKNKVFWSLISLESSHTFTTNRLGKKIFDFSSIWPLLVFFAIVTKVLDRFG